MTRLMKWFDMSTVTWSIEFIYSVHVYGLYFNGGSSIDYNTKRHFRSIIYIELSITLRFHMIIVKWILGNQPIKCNDFSKWEKKSQIRKKLKGGKEKKNRYFCLSTFAQLVHIFVIQSNTRWRLHIRKVTQVRE